ncbi:MAG: DUF4430 domain-containing protein [Planctomycetota bacterium]
MFRLPAIALSLLFITIGCESNQVTQPASNEAVETGTVSFEVILSEDGQESIQFDVSDVAKGSTLESVMRAIDPEDLTLEISGGGLTAFVVSINDQTGGSQSGWVYTVDGDNPDVGIGGFELDPPTTVRWKIASFDEIADNN